MGKHDGATRKLNISNNASGQVTASAAARPSNVDVTPEVSPKSHLPGVIIFVHGVNSEGEWYEEAEQALCDGLNKRLFLEKGNKFELKPNLYRGDKKSEVDRILNKGDMSYLIESNNSPVIRFYWGYRAGVDLGDYLVPLRNNKGDSYQQYLLDRKLSDKEIAELGPYFWGGGPFQNASTTLNPMWGDFSFSEEIAGGLLSTQWFNPEDDRLLTTAPSRKYYSHAAWRLAMLIQRIRDDYPDDTVTIVSHSKGTMVAAAAALISAPDALFLLNSPYRMMNIMTDYSAVDKSEWVSDAGREETLKAVVKAVAENENKLAKSGLEKHISLGKGKDGRAWTPNALHGGVNGKDIRERDNHGRTYIYCNAHDRVMGSVALVSIGWQGLPNSKDGKMHPLLAECEGKLFQRLMARSTPCGGEPNAKTNFGTLPDMYKEPFWDNMGFAVEINSWAVKVAYPVFLLKDSFMPIWETPPEWQTMNINAEEVPEPLTDSEMKVFDENNRHKDRMKQGPFGEGWGQKTVKDNKIIDNDDGYRYYLPIFQMKELGYQKDKLKAPHRYSVTLLNTLPEGIEPSPAAEKQRLINRSKGELGINNGWIVWQYKNYVNGNTPQKAGVSDGNRIFHYYCYLEFNTKKYEDALKQTDEKAKTYISRPTDHSTLPRNQKIMSRVLAFDLPIGFGRSLDNIKEALITQADWTLPNSDFYMEKGVLAQNSGGAALIEEYFANQTKLSPAMPSTVNHSRLTQKELDVLLNEGHEVAKDYEEAKEHGIVYD
ncbi:T6SS effector phospholipase Tle3 domain-containing protein [Limnobaculum parvum]|uniref:T6SS Tle3 phospholipase effector alpha/beta domain-containing protein n=1 Tax=Limnobaculum parvum TaxID=2172103 RepID=A0A2Y9TWK9_9GAMM|nr:hypothetical protein [Limnobaculum parvum]AWH87889.1 hypothetical protein HYN51_04535 [Limnobaculum parvum]